MLIPKIEEIRHRREAAGLSRQRLSIMAGLPSNTVLRIEAGRASYTYPIRAKALAEALQCEIKDIFTETKDA